MIIILKNLLRLSVSGGAGKVIQKCIEILNKVLFNPIIATLRASDQEEQ
jgi:hypothetical protein